MESTANKLPHKYFCTIPNSSFITVIMLTYKFNFIQVVVSYSSNKSTTKFDPYLFDAVQIAVEILNLGIESVYHSITF